MRMLGLLQDNYSRHSTNMSNKTSQRVFSLAAAEGNFHYSSPCKVVETWHASLSGGVWGCWVTRLVKHPGVCGHRGASICVSYCPVPPYGQGCSRNVHTDPPKTCRTKKGGKKRFHIYQWVFLWGYHTCRMCWVKKKTHTHRPQKTSHILSGIVGVKSRKA